LIIIRSFTLLQKSCLLESSVRVVFVLVVDHLTLGRYFLKFYIS
jgi:hypothetical protein